MRRLSDIAHRPFVPLAAILVALFAWATRLPAQSVAPASQDLRIVSLSPSATEMLFVLGVGPWIVGATDHCDYPPAAKTIERVGGFGRPNIEKLLALRPDLVVATGLERPELARLLDQSGIRLLNFEVHSIDEMFAGLRRIGQAVGRSSRAEAAIAAMQAELSRVAAQSRARLDGRRPRVFLELWQDPLTTAGGSSFVDDVIARAGGVNVAHDLPQPHPRINPEKVIQWNPDVIVVLYMNRGPEASAQMAQRIGWSDIAAVKKGCIVRDLAADLILRPGPRLIDGVRELAQRLDHTASSERATSAPLPHQTP
jgi:iron complex transport system substrate-binding protein